PPLAARPGARTRRMTSIQPMSCRRRRPCRSGNELPVQKWIPAFAGMTLMIVVTACTVGPDYQRPAAPVPVAYKEAARKSGWQVARPADAFDRGAWWSVYNDAVLDGIERQIDISNQNLKSAEARIRQAEAIG